MTTINSGKNTVVISLIVDEATHRKFDAFNFGVNYLRNIANIPHLNAANDLPMNFINPLIYTCSNNFQSTWVITAQSWFELSSPVDSREFCRAFIIAWNTTIADTSNTTEFLFPGLENMEGSINAIESGSQYEMANLQASIPYVTSFFNYLINNYHFSRGQIEVQAYGLGDRTPVHGFDNFDNVLVSSVLKSNSPLLIGTSVNPVNITAAIASGARSAITSARDVAREVSENPDVQAAVNSVRQMIPDNILPISSSEWQMAKNVVVYGGIIFGGVLLVKSINAGVGKS
jgi:hypothetical protein